MQSPSVMAQRTDHAPSPQTLRDLEPLGRYAQQLPDELVQRAFDAGVVGIANGEYVLKATCRRCKEHLFLPATELSVMALRFASAMAHDDCVEP